MGVATFFYHRGQLGLGRHIGDVTFFNPGGQLGPCVVDVTDCFQFIDE